MKSNLFPVKVTFSDNVSLRIANSEAWNILTIASVTAAVNSQTVRSIMMNDRKGKVLL